MLRSLRNLPIRTKVTMVILFTAGSVLLVAALALYGFQLFHFRREFIRDTAVLAEIVANHNTAAVAFKDSAAAAEMLDLLRARQDILEATIRLNDGAVLARYVAHTNAPLVVGYLEQGHAFSDDYLLYSQPVQLEGLIRGRLELCVNFMRPYRERMKVYPVILGGVVFSCALLALLLSGRLSRFITDPILRLTYMARSVTECQNFSVRADARGQDELGVLARTFNQMLDHVHQSNAIMQSQIAERTLAAAELREAKERAEAASRAKSQFLANMSHEIRTPLNGVTGMLHLLRKTPLQPQQARYVTNAHTAAQALLTVIGDILDFSRIEAGKMELDSESFAPRDLMHQTVVLFAERAERQHLELLCQVDSGVPAQVIGDPNRLRQILINLIGNALKFTKHGHVAVGCRLDSANSEEVILHFTVTDTGCGIAPEEQAAVFDAFSQADNSMTRQHGGTGLGLAISRQLCELMGGNVTLKSAPGVGSEFSFRVKLRPRATAVAQSPRAAFPKVLVLDDNAASREMLVAQIHAWRGAVQAVADPEAACAALREAAAAGAPFAIVLVDWSLPGHSAPALAARIRGDVSLGSPAVILLSQHSPEEDAGQLQQLGFAAFVTKPVRSSELFDAVMTVMHRRTGGGLVPAAGTFTPGAATHRNGDSLLVLLAEDNAINQEVAREMLDGLGHRCLCVVNGREAVEVIQRQRPDVVLMDCQMPVLDGYGATREIRAWEKANGLARLPVVALTAHALKGDRERCLTAGMDDYLAKPLDPEVLAAVVVRWSAPGAFAGSTSGPEAADAADRVRPPIDTADLLQRCLGRRELASRLLQKFIHQAQGDAADIRSALHSHDSVALTAAAQRLRSSATNVSAGALHDIAMQLDALGRSGNLRGGEDLADHLAVRLKEVNEFVTTHLKEAGSTVARARNGHSASHGVTGLDPNSSGL